MYDLGHRSNSATMAFFYSKQQSPTPQCHAEDAFTIHSVQKALMTACWSIFEAKTTNLNKATDEVPKLLGKLDLRVFKFKK
jgi:hypothetical protein